MLLQVLKHGRRVEVSNAFCPTGKGGGVDPTCGKGGKGSREVRTQLTPDEIQKISEWRENLWNKGFVTRLTKRTVKGGDLHHLHPGSITVYRRGSKKSKGNSYSKSIDGSDRYLGKLHTLKLSLEIPALDINKALKDIPSRSEIDEEVFVVH